MVGGGPATKAVFHVTRGPASLPSFVYDVAEAFAEFVNASRYALASGERALSARRAGGRQGGAARAARGFTPGSDHQVYTDSSFRIPAIYLNDWPDRYIHTNLDLPANIDPTKLERAGFIGAASAWYLANLVNRSRGGALSLLVRAALERAARILGIGAVASEEESRR